VSDLATFKFRLYIAGATENSGQALANLKQLCLSYLNGRHEIEIVDVFREPKRALTEGIFMTPTLVKVAPGPIQKIIGTLNQVTPIVQALGLEALGR
jgi:circadian clock protein KaiB